MYIKESVNFGGKELSIETGQMAKQADGSVVVRYGDTMVLVTAVANKSARAGVDFMPLTVEYAREDVGRRQDPGRLLQARRAPDRARGPDLPPHRPPVAPAVPQEAGATRPRSSRTVLSNDKENPSDVLAMTGASAALHISDIPWAGPFAGVRVGRVGAPRAQVHRQPDLRRARGVGSRPGRRRQPRRHRDGRGRRRAARPRTSSSTRSCSRTRRRSRSSTSSRSSARRSASTKREFAAPVKDPAIAARVKEIGAREAQGRRWRSATSTSATRRARRSAETARRVGRVRSEAEASAPSRPRDEEIGDGVRATCTRRSCASMVLDEGVRIDGRKTTDIRPITLRSGPAAAHARLGAVHARRDPGAGDDHARHRAGRAAHRRAPRRRRQALHAALQLPAVLDGRDQAAALASRREIGHGHLAERALARVLPAYEDFPYTIRIVSETLESNGSLVDGVGVRRLPVADGRGRSDREPVAGIAMGLIKEGDKRRRPLRHPRRRGSPRRHGLQGLRHQARHHRAPDGHQDPGPDARDPAEGARTRRSEGRLHILGKMAEALAAPREELSQARAAHLHPAGQAGPDPRHHRPGRQDHPRHHRPDRRRHRRRGRRHRQHRLVGRRVGQEGDRHHQGPHDRARGRRSSTMGVVQRIADFGAFVEILPGTDGLVHI